jgi:hypothetical protein
VGKITLDFGNEKLLFNLKLFAGSSSSLVGSQSSLPDDCDKALPESCSVSESYS